MKYIYRKIPKHGLIINTRFSILNRLLAPYNMLVIAICNIFCKFNLKITANDYDVSTPNIVIATLAIDLIKKHRAIKRVTYPLVCNSDIPKSLVIEGKPTIYAADKWNYVLDEMDYGLNSIINPNTYPNTSRAQNGLELFGKYFCYLTL